MGWLLLLISSSKKQKNKTIVGTFLLLSLLLQLNRAVCPCCCAREMCKVLWSKMAKMVFRTTVYSYSSECSSLGISLASDRVLVSSPVLLVLVAGFIAFYNAENFLLQKRRFRNILEPQKLKKYKYETNEYHIRVLPKNLLN